MRRRLPILIVTLVALMTFQCRRAEAPSPAIQPFEASEYDVYRYVLEMQRSLTISRFDSTQTTFVVLDSTVETHFSSGESYFRDKTSGKLVKFDLWIHTFPKTQPTFAWEEIAESYHSKNKHRCPLERDSLLTATPVVLMPGGLFWQIFYDRTRETGPWPRFYAEYPKAYGLISLSRVGFNASRTQAVVLLRHWRGPLDAWEGYLILERKRSGWVVLERYTTSVS
jgi:hypothetical protein